MEQLNYQETAQFIREDLRLKTFPLAVKFLKDKADPDPLLFYRYIDESFFAEKFLPEVSQYKEDIEVIEIEGLTHMGIVMGKEVRDVIKKWMSEI